MPNWNWHVALARDIANIIEIKDFNDFVYGALIPDTPWETIDESFSSGDRYALHLAKTHDYSLSTTCDVSRFLDKALRLMVNTDLACGWYTHLVLDEAVNDNWNLRNAAIGLNKYEYIGNAGVEYLSSEEIAQKKWTDVASYAAEAFGDLSDLTPTSMDSMSDGGLLLLDDTLNIPEDKIAKSLGVIRSKVEELSGCHKDKYEVSKNYYDAIHSECVAKCCRIISQVQAMRH